MAQAVLVNCHFDSVPLSPGASDDAVQCGIMLEVLRALSASLELMANDVLFLFNGAEETPLPASHAFITQVWILTFVFFLLWEYSSDSLTFQHHWAEHASMFVNLEAAGAGAGREVLFQVNNPHLHVLRIVVFELKKILKTCSVWSWQHVDPPHLPQERPSPVRLRRRAGDFPSEHVEFEITTPFPTIVYFRAG